MSRAAPTDKAAKPRRRTTKLTKTVEPSTPAQTPNDGQRETIAELLREVRSLREQLGAERAAPAPLTMPVAAGTHELAGIARRLSATGESLARSVAELPRVSDFEPLAEHLYEFARYAPKLHDALEAIPKAVETVADSVKALEDLSETLQIASDSIADSVARLPRAEDYEPLAGPLKEFARVSPALAESLRDVFRVTAPLAESVSALGELGESLKVTTARLAATATFAATGTGAAPMPRPATAASELLRRAVATMETAAEAIDSALETLPVDPQYGKLAAQLRELASVSPSLMEWMKGVEGVKKPLASSVERLAEAAAGLRAGCASLTTRLTEPRPARQPES